MKLIKVQHPDITEPVYFTTIALASKYIGCSYHSVLAVLKGMFHKIKGNTVEYADVDLCITINPERK